MNKPTTNPYHAYSKASHTVAKTRQVVMLYDGAVRFLNQAREAMESGNIERRFDTLSRASEIITGLQSCLDFDAGSRAAQTLYDFYALIDERILRLHRTNDAGECQRIVDELKQMRDVWDRIDKGDGDSPTTPDAPLEPIIVSA